jgi:predicted nucleic acid-binding protein
MATEKLRLYWDSCAWVSCIENTSGRGPLLRQILNLAIDGEILFVASALVIAEVVKINDPSINSAQQSKLIADFFQNPYIRVRSVDRLIAEEAREISRVHGVKPADAVHIATAIRYKCYSLQTYDGESGKRKKLISYDGQIGIPALKIEVPKMPPKQTSLLP